jgi:hypothetical protein
LFGDHQILPKLTLPGGISPGGLFMENKNAVSQARASLDQKNSDTAQLNCNPLWRRGIPPRRLAGLARWLLAQT